jgi:MoaA/NifB/PqqE/SkfB family radical SAM enzyme
MNKLFCAKPFRWFEVSGWYEPKGDVFMCCPTWLETPIGNIQCQSVEEIWNGEKAREIRRSILDGSFGFCNRSRCPYLQTISGPVEKINDVKDEELMTVIEDGLTILPFGPREINCSYDKSCNLSCPSCRTEVIIEKAYERQIGEIQNKLQKEALKDAYLLYITGSGDPFGSPFNRKWLQTMQRKTMPHLKMVHIHTNAQLWTPEMWSTIPGEIRELVKSTEISIDAASPATYALNRRGGSFERLLRNLEFIRTMRKNGPLNSVTISMVVQENNFREMPDFVSLGKCMDFDNVYFSRLVNWGTFSEEEFKSRAIHLPSHPRHHELLALLRNEVFREPIVHSGNLTELMERK